MADFGAPVADHIQPPNPNQGLTTLSDLLAIKSRQIGIAQQQVALQSQQQQLSSAQSAAAQAAIHTQNLKGLQSVNWAQFNTSDGGYDIEAAQAKAAQVGGADAPEFSTRLANMAQTGTAAKQALFSLNQEQQAPIRAIYGTWAANSKLQVPDLLTELQTYEKTLPAGQQSNVDQMISATTREFLGPDLYSGQPRTLAQQKQLALGFARAGLTPSEVGGAAGIATPGRGTIDTGGQVVPGSTAPAASAAPGAFSPQGAPVSKTVAPQVVTQPITGGQYILEPNGSVTPIGGGKSASGGTPWWQGSWQPAPGTSQFTQIQTASIAHRIQAGEVAANSAPTAIDALNRARAILDKGTWTGSTFSLFKDLKNTAAGLGVDTSSAQNASELVKNLARYEGARAGSVGQTDAARSLYEAGAPNTHMDAAAVKSVVLQSLGIERMLQGYAKVVGGAPTPQAALQAEQKFRSIPHLVQAYELGFLRDKASADEFFKRYGVSGRELAKSAAELRALGAM